MSLDDQEKVIISEVELIVETDDVDKNAATMKGDKTNLTA